MIGQAKIDERAAQPYLGLRRQVGMQALPEAIPQGIDAVFGYLAEQGLAPAGPPFMRMHVVNMEGEMDMEVGVPVEAPAPGNDRIRPGVLPSGRYASLIYRDVKQGYPANAALLDWGAKQGLVFDQWAVPTGDAFAGRYERF